uniref:M-phase inducer phosphatase 1 isoform X1 n=1 Tax=Ciona intestinalis TaxID=7719 RepID=UPI000052107A|nr:M-phase inducer phosphatase 1 isoform X1 [Ciona intestinalis]|eukprot:XP_002128266.1 M-phase inducer phosphatase 1 isoform X1 [Ciona intestinalis]
MTDSGFSSAASNRSSSSIIRPAILNSFDGSNPKNNLSETGQSISGGRYSGLPKPACLQNSTGRPVIPNRLLYGRNHGGYSPGLYSPKEMSPMSSLAFDFRDLNTSQEASDTPRKRLSLSSLSNTDSPQVGPGTLSFASSFNSPSQVDDEGCFTEPSTPAEQSGVDSHYGVLQERKENCSSFQDGKSSFRRFKSVPNARFRLYGTENSAGKENNLGLSKRNFSKRLQAVEVTSPLALPTSPTFSPATPLRRHASMVTSPMLTSSPMATNFASSSTSAFSAVDHKQLHKEAEQRLRDSTGSSAGGSTPEKSAVPGSIAALTSRGSRALRPASAIPFGRAKSSPCCSTNISPIPIRANKRSLDATSCSIAASSKRAKCSGSSFTEARSSSRRRMAFSSMQRKTKSAEAAFMHSSPIASIKQGFRPISAPAQMLAFEDDSPLTHSRLCSTNDSDSEDDVMMMSSEYDRSDADEKLLEEMLSENVRVQKIGGNLEVESPQAPSGIAGLITAPLLLSSKPDTSMNNSIVTRLPKPRELFRSPSAPPVVPSRRALHALKRSQERIDESSTPSAIRRPTSTGADDSMSALLGSSNSPSTKSIDEHNVSLNRSRSANELDIMRAVDLGCTDPNLVGDFSRVCTLSTVSGKQQDLKYITPKTLIDLVNNKYDVGRFEVIDCRYPYEYEGGHVLGANSIWEEEQLYKRYFSTSNPMWADNNDDKYKPPVLIFYCEFSSERGPRMARALRSKDRELNRYPHLHYPEVYVLKDGYKNFFSTKGTKQYCDPPTYRPMTHEDYTRELRMCRIKSKTWAGEKTKCSLYNRLKRL